MAVKLITRDTDYAIRALVCIACAKRKTVTARDLVQALKIPRPFLRKILQRLGQAGLLESRKGQGGGFVLTAALKEISLLKLIGIFQGPFSLNECFFKKEICPNVRRCGLKRKIDGIEKRLARELGAIKISCLLKEKKR